MSFSLLMVNLWIGLCRGDRRLPRDLKDLGYEDRIVDDGFQNQDGQRVVPDLVIASSRTQHTVLLEFKSGDNTERDQLQRYSRVTRSDLRVFGFLSSSETAYHDTAIVGKASSGDRLQLGIDEGPHPFPLIVAQDDGLALRHNAFSVQAMEDVFTPCLHIDWSAAPRSYIAIDGGSELWEVAEVLIPRVLQYMQKRAPRIDSEILCTDTCQIWSQLGKEAKERYRRKVADCMVQAANGEFKSYLRWVTRGSTSIGRVEIISNPLEVGQSKRSATYRQLANAHAQFIQRLRPPSGSDAAVQLPLDL